MFSYSDKYCISLRSILKLILRGRAIVNNTQTPAERTTEEMTSIFLISRTNPIIGTRRSSAHGSVINDSAPSQSNLLPHGFTIVMRLKLIMKNGRRREIRVNWLQLFFSTQSSLSDTSPAFATFQELVLGSYNGALMANRFVQLNNRPKSNSISRDA